MNVHPVDGVRLAAHFETEQTPRSLLTTQVPAVDVSFDLVVDLYMSAVMTLVHVLKQVLDRFDAGAHLQVDVSPVLEQKETVVRNYVTVVESVVNGSMSSAAFFGERAIVIAPTIDGILLRLTHGLGNKVFGILLAANVFFGHADASRIGNTTWSMKHVRCDNLKENWIPNTVWQLGRNK